MLTVVEPYDIGIVGLGAMGRGLLYNLSDHNVPVVGHDENLERVETVRRQGAGRGIRATESLTEFVGLLRVPRIVLILVSAGQTIDRAVQDLLLHLTAGDVIVDCGDSYFRDTDRRAKCLAEKGIHYFGIGISGGEHGARYGSSIMVGGPAEAYECLRPVLEACASQMHGGQPCLAHLGPGSSGHYVKMVLDAIECGLMGLIAESYDLLQRGVSLSTKEIYAIYRDWNRGRFRAYLLEVTAHILSRADESSGQRLIDLILDEAEQRQAAVWAVEEALKLQVSVSTVNTALTMRILSKCKKERTLSSGILRGPTFTFQGEREYFIKEIRNALFAGMIITYCQGMALLRAASQAYGYDLDLATVARIWRGGSTISAAILEDVQVAYAEQPSLSNLLLSSRLAKRIVARQNALRDVVRWSAKAGIPVSGMMSAVSYFDAYRTSRLPANLIQAQQDYLGGDGYKRVDADGVFHTQWFHED
ncbi:MAG: NADP-dependent phosphogluconate dehydrogenase [Candidatus Binatia bacterium]